MAADTLAPTPTGPALDAMAERLAEALFFTATWTNKESVWADLVKDRTRFTRGVIRGFREQAAAILARLAERGTGAGAEPDVSIGNGHMDIAPGDGRLGEAALDAVGEVIASKMKHDTLDHYRRERIMFQSGELIDRDAPGYTGHYEGCLEEAESFVDRLRKRGFEVAALAQAGQDAEGWKTIDTCPSKGEPVWVWRPDCHTPSRHQADGEYWRRRLREGSIYAPTHWCHDRVPTPPAQFSGSEP